MRMRNWGSGMKRSMRKIWNYMRTSTGRMSSWRKRKRKMKTGLAGKRGMRTWAKLSSSITRGERDVALKELKAIKAAAALKTATTGSKDDEQASASTQAELATALKTADSLKNQLTDTQAALAVKEEELATTKKTPETKQEECDNKQKNVDQAAVLVSEKQLQLDTAEKEVEELKVQLAKAIPAAMLPESSSLSASF
jgi:chromosome segregation ATPase